jgi:hypothetical protein
MPIDCRQTKKRPCRPSQIDWFCERIPLYGGALAWLAQTTGSFALLRLRHTTPETDDA